MLSRVRPWQVETSNDANGNRASKAAGGVTETYVVDDADKLTSITVGGTAVKTYSYDTAGRTTSVVTSAGTTSLMYDYESRITQITYPSSATNTFTYNGLDTRVGKVDSAGTSTYKRDGDYVTDPVLEDGTAKFTPGVSDRRGSSTRFYHPDRMGSVLRHTSSSQGSTASRQYDAFGNVVSASGTFALPFGFAGNWGYQEDTDSGLKLVGHRYYDSSTGRFLTRDPAKFERNWYSYCGNNPLRFIDTVGLLYKEVGGLLGAALTGAAVGSVGGPAGIVAGIVVGLVLVGVGSTIGAGIDGAVSGKGFAQSALAEGDSFYRDPINWVPPIFPSSKFLPKTAHESVSGDILKEIVDSLAMDYVWRPAVTRKTAEN